DLPPPPVFDVEFLAPPLDLGAEEEFDYLDLTIPDITILPAQYRLLADHYLASGYAQAGTVVTEGLEIPLDWIPTLATEPINLLAIRKYWLAWPRGMADAEAQRDFYPTYWNRGVNLVAVGAPLTAPTVYWRQVGKGKFQLTGDGASYGPYGVVDA